MILLHRKKNKKTICECVINHLSPLSSRIKAVANNAFRLYKCICITCNARANTRWFYYIANAASLASEQWKSGGAIMVCIKYSYDMRVAGSRSKALFKWYSVPSIFIVEILWDEIEIKIKIISFHSLQFFTNKNITNEYKWLYYNSRTPRPTEYWTFNLAHRANRVKINFSRKIHFACNNYQRVSLVQSRSIWNIQHRKWNCPIHLADRLHRRKSNENEPSTLNENKSIVILMPNFNSNSYRFTSRQQKTLQISESS